MFQPLQTELELERLGLFVKARVGEQGEAIEAVEKEMETLEEMHKQVRANLDLARTDLVKLREQFDASTLEEICGEYVVCCVLPRVGMRLVGTTGCTDLGGVGAV